MRVKGKNTFSKLEEYIERNEKWCILALMLFSAVFLVAPFWGVYPLHTTTDELGAIVGAATWAGYDWSGVIPRSGYYGFGYYALFAPLFALHLSPIAIYRIILIVTRVLRGCVISGTVYYIGKHYFKFSSKVLLMLLTFICTLPMYADMDGTIVNDIILEAVLWLIILLQCKLVEHMSNPRKCVLVGCGYVAACAYATLLHTRAIVIIIASFMTMMGVLIYKRNKTLLLAILTLPAAGVLKVFIKSYQSSVWSSSGSGLTNASVTVHTDFSIFDIDTWIIWFDILVGNVTVQTLLTGGLFLAAVVVALKYLCGVIFCKKESESVYVNMVLIMTILCMGAVFVAFFVSDWFMGMYETWGTDKMGVDNAYKGLCYVRYWNVFAMPFVFTGCYLIQKREVSTWIKAFVGWFGALLAAFSLCVVPLVKNHSAASTFLCKFLTKPNEKITQSFYYKCILICIVILLITCVVYYVKRNYVLALLPILIMMVIGYGNANKFYNENVNKSVSSMVLASYKQKCLLEEANIKIDKVYAVDKRKTDPNWYLFSVLQFYFYEHTVQEELPKEMGDYDIIVTRKPDAAIAEDYPNLQCYVLDDNEVWYTELDLIGVRPE